MTDRNPQTYHLSATAINALKACPTRFRLAYREGLRLDQDTEAQRIGTHWHALHEEYNKAQRWAHEHAGTVHDVAGKGYDSPNAYAYAWAVEHLNAAYAEVPSWVEPEDWETERLVLLTAFHTYLWYYENDPIESLAEEIAFDLPLHEPRTGMPLPTKEVLRVGKIDTVIKWQNMVGNREMKSTSRSIGPDSDYWERSAKDTQVSMYALAMRDMLESGELPDNVTTALDGKQFGNTLYDVWRKPKSKPKGVTQKDTAAFLETSTYYGQEFGVEVEWETAIEKKELKKSTKEIEHRVPKSIKVDGQEVNFEISKTYKPVIRETPRMFAARLMDDMVNNPSEYFVRKEIARTDADLRRFRVELYRIYQAMRSYERSDAWFENENQCRATFKCAYIPICYGEGADKVCENNLTPPDFKRIFNITVEGEDINDQHD